MSRSAIVIAHSAHHFISQIYFLSVQRRGFYDRSHQTLFTFPHRPLEIMLLMNAGSLYAVLVPLFLASLCPQKGETISVRK